MAQKKIPKTFRPFLWSYDIDKIDPLKHKKRIITNILNLGTERATKELFKVYNIKDIKEAVKNPLPGEWNKKSLNFWSLILNVKPRKIKRRFK